MDNPVAMTCRAWCPSVLDWARSSMRCVSSRACWPAAVDVSSSEASRTGHDPTFLTADIVWEELHLERAEVSLAVRQHARLVRTTRSLPAAAKTQQSKQLRTDGVYLVTGGLGDVGAALSEYLAATPGRATLVLMNRSRLPAGAVEAATLDEAAWHSYLADVLTTKKHCADSLACDASHRPVRMRVSRRCRRHRRRRRASRSGRYRHTLWAA